MCRKELTDVFTEHAEYESLVDVDETDVGRQLFSFINNYGESIEYNAYTDDSFIATYTDRQETSHHYRVTPQISIRVSTLVVNRYGYTMVEDTTDIGSLQETAES